MAIITRAGWGAPRNTARRVGTARKTRTFLHHTVTPQWVGAQAARNLDRIARGRGFRNGISYSQLADRQGNEIEGRGWGRDGAHTAGYNTVGEAVCLVGNFDADRPPPAMLRAVARLARKSRPGRITHGHRDVGQTACPGRHAYARIADINAMTGAAPAPDPQEDDVIYKLVKAHGTPDIYAVGGGGMFRVPTPGHLKQLRDAQLIRPGGVPELDPSVIKAMLEGTR